MAYNTLGKMNPNFEPVAKTLGIKRWRLIKDVFLPQTWGTVDVYKRQLISSLDEVNVIVCIGSHFFVSDLSNRRDTG